MSSVYPVAFGCVCRMRLRLVVISGGGGGDKVTSGLIVVCRGWTCCELWEGVFTYIGDAVSLFP